MCLSQVVVAIYFKTTNIIPVLKKMHTALRTHEMCLVQFADDTTFVGLISSTGGLEYRKALEHLTETTISEVDKTK